MKVDEGGSTLYSLERMHLEYVCENVGHVKEPQKGVINAGMMGFWHWIVLVWNIWERWYNRGLLFSCSGGHEVGEKDCKRQKRTGREDHTESHQKGWRHR